MKKEDTESFVFWAHEAGRLNLLSCSSGNLSQRLDDGTMVISATKSWLPYITEQEIAQISIYTDEITGSVKPSGEYRLHREILRCRPEINTVLHFQSPSATTIACMEIEPDYNVIIEVPIYIGEIVKLPYILPGSDELAKAVAAQSLKTSLIQMSNHGQIVCGKDYRDVIQKAVFFELACNILLKSNFSAKSIDPENLPILRSYKG